MTPRELYAAMVEFAQENGLRREEFGSGWWWGDKLPTEATLGPAIEELLSQHGIDTRDAVPGEVTEFWG